MTFGATATGPLLLGRYDAAAVMAMFEQGGVLAAIASRGFAGFEVEIDDSAGPLTHTRLLAAKQGRRVLLVDACLTEVRVEAGDLRAPGYQGSEAIDLLVAYWLREQDPTVAFDPSHPRLPLQEHPGLGVLRNVFRIALRIARELGKHGIAALPKFFHDAAIFHRSRLFLFLDPREQGRFEALLRDLAHLALSDASLALAGGAVRDLDGHRAAWNGGLQVMPLRPPLTDYFHAEDYQAACREALDSSHFVLEEAALHEAREIFERSLAAGRPQYGFGPM